MSKAVRERHVRCAACDVPMRLRGKSRLHYSCPKCSATLIADEHGRPRGIPGTKEDRRWRRQAHTVFDRIWRSGTVTRSAAQRWLAKELRIPVKDCHFSYMRVKTLRRVVQLCDAVQNGDRAGPCARDKDERTSMHRRMASRALRLLRRTGAHPVATRNWLAHHVGLEEFVDVGSLDDRECERLVRVIAQAFAGRLKLPRHGQLDNKLKLELLKALPGIHLFDDAKS